MIRRVLASAHLDAIDWSSVVRQALTTAVIVMVAVLWLFARVDGRQDTFDTQQAVTRGTLINGCERTRERNAFLRVKLNPTPAQASRYLPMLDCEATTDAGGVPVPAAPTVVKRLLIKARSGS